MIHYKFKSSLDYDTISFEGAGLPVWELKKEIVALKKLGSFHDFDLVITNAQTGEDYADEYQMVPKNTSVVVKRVPMSSAMLAQRERKQTIQPSSQLNTSISTSKSSLDSNMTKETNEEDRIKTMLTQSGAHWDRSSEQMAEQQQLSHNSSQIKRFIPKRNFLNPTVATRPPPSTYTCFRCGQKGHYINACPTNEDPNFNPPRIKRTTGIPKTFLKPVSSVEDENVMVTSDGTLVSVPPNERIWNQMTTVKGTGMDAEFMASIPAHLKCPICSGIMREAMEMPCCGASYCDECIREILLNEDRGVGEEFVCPSCKRAPIYPDTLLPNKVVRQAIDELMKSMNISKSAATLRTSQQLKGKTDDKKSANGWNEDESKTASIDDELKGITDDLNRPSEHSSTLGGELQNKKQPLVNAERIIELKPSHLNRTETRNGPEEERRREQHESKGESRRRRSRSASRERSHSRHRPDSSYQNRSPKRRSNRSPSPRRNRDRATRNRSRSPSRHSYRSDRSYRR